MNPSKIITTNEGNQILEFIRLTDGDAIPEAMRLLNYSQVIASFNNCFLLTFNRERKQWEFPGGKIEKGESLRECAERETFEESGQRVCHLQLKALIKSYFKNMDKVLYGAIFIADLTEIRAFEPTPEIVRIKLWNPAAEAGYIDHYGLTLLNMVLPGQGYSS